MKNESWVAALSWAAICVPVVLAFTNALIRSIVKKNNFWSWENLYMGIDLCFASLAASMVELILLFREFFVSSGDGSVAAVAQKNAFRDHYVVPFMILVCLCVVSGIALLCVTRLYQRWDVDAQIPQNVVAQEVVRRLKAHRRGQILWLGIASNGLGLISFSALAFLRLEKVI